MACQNAIRDASDFLAANVESVRDVGVVQEGRILGANKWQRPQHGGISRLIFDGGVDRQGKECGLGMVVRDWHGRLIAARAVHEHHVTDPLSVEALAAREGLQ